MKLEKAIQYLLLCLPFQTSFVTTSITDEIIENLHWDGLNIYIAVDRRVIQKKIDDWHSSNSGVCQGPRLYLPTTPVFPDIIDKNEHVVFISPGHVNLQDFNNFDESRSPEAGTELSVTIPFLTDKLKGPPHYALTLANFYDRSRGDDFPKANFVYPYLPVDEITMKNGSFIMTNGSDEMRFSYEMHTDPCQTAATVVRHEFEEFTQQEYQLGSSEPDFSFCDRHPVDNHFCSTGKKIRCNVHRYSPNICQTSWNVLSRVLCKGSLKFESVSPGFRNMMLLPDGPIKIVDAEAEVGNYSLGLKYPCFEN